MPLRATPERTAQEFQSGNPRASNQRCSNPTLASSRRNFQGPFRFIHSARTNWGRGYSGRGMSVGECESRGAIEAILTVVGTIAEYHGHQDRWVGLLTSPSQPRVQQYGYRTVRNVSRTPK